MSEIQNYESKIIVPNIYNYYIITGILFYVVIIQWKLNITYYLLNKEIDKKHILEIIKALSFKVSKIVIESQKRGKSLH